MAALNKQVTLQFGFFAKRNQSPIKIQSVTRGAALSPSERVKLKHSGQQEPDQRWASRSCAKENSAATAGRLYLHLAEQIAGTLMKVNSWVVTQELLSHCCLFPTPRPFSDELFKEEHLKSLKLEVRLGGLFTEGNIVFKMTILVVVNKQTH